MLPLFLFGILYAFLIAGAAIYLIFIAVPRTRRYALSSALWVAAFGSCLAGLLIFGGFGLYFVVQYLGIPHRDVATAGPQHHQAILGWIYTIVGLFTAIVVATGTALLHQIIIHRFTFFLFRLYATAVSAGIGATLAVGLGSYMLASFHENWASYAFLLLVTILTGSIGTFAYRSARTLRGTQPERFPWVTPEEFSGLPTT
jgi:hypothetical protein